jgi:phenazine biosynthesis protein phzE
MGQLRAAVAELVAAERPFLAVCLGHQALCHHLGVPLAFKDIVFQGTQSPVRIDGHVERVGFYNTFVGRVDGVDARGRATIGEGVHVEADPATGDVHLVAGPHYRGIQFHAESILTQNGFALIHRLVRDLLVGA